MQVAAFHDLPFQPVSEFHPFHDDLQSLGLQLEDAVAAHLKGLTTAAEVQECIEDLLDDEDVLSLFQRLNAAVTRETLRAVLAAGKEEFAVPPHLPEDVYGARLRIGLRLTRTRVQLHMAILWTLARTGALVEFLQHVERHPRVRRSFLSFGMSEVAFLAILSSDRHSYPPEVVDSLVDMWIAGQRAFYSYLAAVAERLALKPLVDDELLPDGMMDLDLLSGDVQRAAKNRDGLLDEARRSGQAVYPPPKDVAQR